MTSRLDGLTERGLVTRAADREDGRLVRVGLASGHEQGSMRYTLAQCYSAPAVVGDTLVTGDQDGVVHGIRLPAGPGSCG